MRELRFQKLLEEINNEKTGRNAKDITYKKKFYKRNLELGIDAACFECTSHCLSNGYPKYRKEGFRYLHRYIYYKVTGKKPEVVLHKCDNPQCINPRHLQGGTKADNNQDRAKKGRTVSPSGEKHYNSKLSTEQVNTIRGLYSTGHYKQRDLGDMFSVSQFQINYIVNGKSRKNG